MKIKLKLIFVLFLLLGLFFACANKKAFWEGLSRGFYDGSHQYKEMRQNEPYEPLGQETPSYEEYKRQREEMIKGQDN